MKKSIPLYNRHAQRIEFEQVFEQWFMDFFYGSTIGLWLENLIIKRSGFSKLYGVLQRSERSQKKIKAFIERYGIDLSELNQPVESFSNFNEFFVRQLKPAARPVDTAQNALVSPCDGRLLAYSLTRDRVIPVKAKPFTLAQLLGDKALAAAYQDGVCLVFRLAPVDYHRFIYIDEGRQQAVRRISGHYHSVSPLALQRMIASFTENEREYVVLETQHFGQVVHLDVGALVVGRIVQHEKGEASFSRGQEKGYFEFGGSTIILLFKAGVVSIDPDILDYSKNGTETLVKSEPIGQSTLCH